MPDLNNRLRQDLKEAQLKKEDLRVSVLRLLLASLNNREIEKRTKLSKSSPLEKLDEFSKLTEEEIIEVIVSEAKKRKEAILGFTQGGRKDSAEKEKKELEILETYLPKPLSQDELKEIVIEVVAKTNAKTINDLGKVMKELMPEIKKRGRAEGELVSQIVREQLSPRTTPPIT